MAMVQIAYTWPEGGTLSVALEQKITTPEALTAMVIDAKRLWHEAMVEMRADDLAHGEAAPDGTPGL